MLVYFTLTGQTSRLSKKLLEAADSPFTKELEISPANPFIEIDEPYVLLVPSYEEMEVQECFEDFLETGENLSLCKGMVASGNRNFGDLFLVTAKHLHQMYDLPIIKELEFSGTPRDVEDIVKKGLNLWTPHQ